MTVFDFYSVDSLAHLKSSINDERPYAVLAIRKTDVETLKRRFDNVSLKFIPYNIPTVSDKKLFKVEIG